ncbi:MAG: alkaline phosphatase family protein, partial [Pseudomonadota bacterium]
DVTDYPVYEITSSSLNLQFRHENNEPGPHRIGQMYTPANYGVIGIDWQSGQLTLQIKALDGTVVREQSVDMLKTGAR